MSKPFRTKPQSGQQQTTYREKLANYGIPSHRPNGGQHGSFLMNEVATPRGNAYMEIQKKNTPRGIYGETIHGGKWGHRSITPGDKYSDTALKVVYKIIRTYNEDKQIGDDEEERQYPESNRKFLLFYKLNGVHCFIFVKRTAGEDERGMVSFIVTHFAGKQNDFDGVQRYNANFGNVCKALLDKAEFKIHKSNMPAGFEELLLQAELIIDDPDNSSHNFADVCNRVFAFQNARDKNEKCSILKGLGIRFFNAGGYESSSGLNSEKYTLLSMDKIKAILDDLEGQRYYPDYNPEDQCCLRVCQHMYFDENSDLSSDDLKAALRTFVHGYHDGEGFIGRCDHASLKIKRVYHKRNCYATPLLKHVIPVLLRPGTSFCRETPIEGIVIAPPRSSEDHTCEEISTIAFGRQPGLCKNGIQYPDYFDGSTTWVAADYATMVCSTATPLQHKKTPGDAPWKRCHYEVQLNDETFHYSLRDIESKGFKLQFLHLGTRIANPQVPSCLLFRANQILVKGRDTKHIVLDTPVFQGLFVSGAPDDFSRLTRLQQCEVLMPQPTDEHYHELDWYVKIILRNYVFGTCTPTLIEEWAQHNLPESPADQIAFIHRKLCLYSDLQENPKPVHVMEYYKLLEKIIKPRKGDPTNPHAEARSPQQLPRPVSQSPQAQHRVSPASPLKCMLNPSDKKITAVKDAYDTFNIPSRVDLYQVLELTLPDSQRDVLSTLRAANPTSGDLARLTRVWKSHKPNLDRKQVDEILKRDSNDPVQSPRLPRDGDGWYHAAAARPMDRRDAQVIPFNVVLPVERRAPRSDPLQDTNLDQYQTESEEELHTGDPEPTPAPAPAAMPAPAPAPAAMPAPAIMAVTVSIPMLQPKQAKSAYTLLEDTQPSEESQGIDLGPGQPPEESQDIDLGPGNQEYYYQPTRSCKRQQCDIDEFTLGAGMPSDIKRQCCEDPFIEAWDE